MKSLTLKARAKINLTLDVVGKRDNGYHDVEMVMQQIDLYDVVTVTQLDRPDIELSCTDDFIPTDQRNIAYKAALLMKKRYNLEAGFQIAIEKNIPVAAGLAGGSTDAAAVIKAINVLCQLNLELSDLMALGLEIGADVPFCILEKCALAEGLGERLTPIRGFEHAWMILIKPGFGVSTKEVYKALKWDTIENHPNTEAMLKALNQQNRHDILLNFRNVLEDVTLDLFPQVADIKAFLVGHSAEGVMMSGSGPTVFGFYKSYDRAKSAHKKIKKHYPHSFVVSTYNG
ncbi:4-(cytidine 5'-diphospho)-2-C-methyl-D-erythritol kinase [Fusibacter tunisiensis]|uniref:4-diphosphocytidyl-2-C-methyl-D-erythritol kinase n=1 Tax=Fusibacter tunisiensis TaxID=1008308 RepID=A0ABS2MNG8_9FIRM|nr:4-(cytidine 5'-diphospho)-2-C-methyl-D-erythritol kinase [Fusibacter tunisiensis]MBM7560956.1 4-diphosphocytidyl-2-C-methyl-D-erythritol kinase [Fusibacter tunisiensis]